MRGAHIAAVAVAASIHTVTLPVAAQPAGSTASPTPVAPPASVLLLPPACPTAPFDVPAFVALLGIELGNDGVVSIELGSAAGPTPLAAITLDVAPCAPGAREVIVTIDDAATRKSVRRTIDLGDVTPDARPRALALATAELLRASWAELAMPAVPPAATPIPPAVRERVHRRLEPIAARAAGPGATPSHPRERPAVMLWGGLESRAFLATGTGLVGGRLGASLPAGTRLRLHLEGGAMYGTVTDPLGDIDLRMASGRVGASLTGEGNGLAAELGPRLELGWGAADGRPFDTATRGSSDGAFLATASLGALLRVRLVGPWWAVVAPEIGGVLRGFRARADERAPAGIAGAMVGVSVGVSLAL